MAPRSPVQDVGLTIYNRDGNSGKTLIPSRTFPVASGYAVAVAPGQLVYLSSGSIELVGAGTAVLGVVDQVYTADGTPFKQGYRPASVAGFCTVVPIQNILLGIVEDAAGGVINFPTNSFVDLLAQTILNTATNNYDPAIKASVMLDSSTAASSAGSLTFQIIRQEDTPDNIRNVGDTTSPLRYLVVPVTALTQSAP